MADPVVSSRFGQRPILEVPALEVFNTTRLMGSLQEDRPKAHPTLGRTGFTAPQPEYKYYQPQPQNPYTNVVGGQAPPMNSYYGMNPLPARPAYTVPAYSQPPDPRYYNNQPDPRYYTYGPYGEVRGGQVEPTYYNPYPGVQSPYHVPPPQPPPPPPPPPMYHRVTDENWYMEGVLEFGRLATVHLKRSSPEFSTLPDFMRRELRQTYGKYPNTDIKITSERGEYHIYAKPQGYADDADYPRSFSHRSEKTNPSYRPRDVEKWYDWDPQNRRDDDYYD